MIDSFQDYAKSVNPLLDAGFTGQLADLLGDAGSLQEYGGAKVLTGGKRIRGSLVCLVTAALGGALEDALPRAIALELIQTATLIHDDFVDQHELRRDLPALWTLEGGRRAVLLGDVIFASAIQSMSELGREDGLVISNAIAEVSRGAYQEPQNPCSLIETFKEDWDGAALYEKIIYLKTGVLFAAACQLGALAARADERLRQKWRCYGSKIGEAYQIADDLHELEKYLVTRSVTGSGLTSIAPALLFFNRDIRPHVLEALRQKVPELNGEFLRLLQSTADAMTDEIERRLNSAVLEIEGCLPSKEYGRLARSTPWDIIRMFNEARPTVSLL
jgi:Polyprenyl synthetase